MLLLDKQRTSLFDTMISGIGRFPPPPPFLLACVHRVGFRPAKAGFRDWLPPRCLQLQAEFEPRCGLYRRFLRGGPEPLSQPLVPREKNRNPKKSAGALNAEKL